MLYKSIIRQRLFLPLILLLLSFSTHFIFFGYPMATVFDEVYNGNFARDYSLHTFYFDVHPPLGKMLVKWFGDIAGVYYYPDFGEIGDTLPDSMILLRMLPLIAGTLLPLVIYGISLQIGLSKKMAFLAGVLLCFENSLIVQSRFILFDCILILFGFTSILLYLIYIKNDTKKYILVASALLAAGSLSIKWTGLSFLLFIFIYELIRQRNTIRIIKFSALFFSICFAFYLSVFVVHFKMLKNPGPGDAFMSQSFQSNGFFRKFTEINIKMLEANTNLIDTHQYSSLWYTWPLMERSIFYWQDILETDGSSSYIYLLGNPFIYWAGFLSVIFLLFHAFFKKNKISAFIILGFLVNFVPFIFIGRVMFLYHYEAALVFSCIAFAWSVGIIPTLKKHENISISVIIGISFVAFIYFAPITYGLRLSLDQLQNRMWFTTWR